MEAKNGVVYQNNYARAIAFYQATCAPVVENDSEKEAAHKFITSIYQMIGEQADSLGFKTVPDVSFKPWETQKGREADVKAVRTPLAKIDELMEQLYSFCRQAEITECGLSVSANDFTPKKMFKSVLSGVGVAVTKNERIELCCGKKCAEGLKKLAEIAITTNLDGTENLAKSVFFFSRCVFDDNVDWLSHSFDNMLDAGGKIVMLCKKLSELGYCREVMIDGRYLSLNYIKEYGKKPSPLKKAWADKNHLGIEISYEDLCIMPATLQLRLPRFTEFLSRVDEMPNEAKRLINEKLKSCDGCRYCVQTDKSGTRPLAAVKVEGIAKCPYFPAFSLRWNEVNDVLIEQIESVLDTYKIFDTK
ncbi:MAG: hypothetical protein E7231_10000 [Cellulosilyticum sp.]|nr:hypothetical protein [Cellulosilyticum sp.]